MKNIISGLIGGIAYIIIFYSIAYVYLFVLSAPGDGFLSTFLSIFILGTVIEILVAVVSTGISGMVALFLMEAMGGNGKCPTVICGILTIIAAIFGALFLHMSGLTIWYIIVFGVAMLLGGLKIIFNEI